MHHFPRLHDEGTALGTVGGVAVRVLSSLLALSLVTACDGLRHPLDDSETRPETQELALDEAGEMLDLVGQWVMDDSVYSGDRWVADDGCATAPFGSSQGDVGLVLIRSYTEESMALERSPIRLLDDFERFWADRGESVSPSSSSMDPGVVARVDGIAYELVSLPPMMELRAYIPCF